MLDDNTPGFIPPLHPSEQAAMSAPPVVYPMQGDGEMVRPTRHEWRPVESVEFHDGWRWVADGFAITYGTKRTAYSTIPFPDDDGYVYAVMRRPTSAADAEHPFPAADLETVLAFVERTGALLPGEEPPAHVNAALRLRAWLEEKA